MSTRDAHWSGPARLLKDVWSAATHSTDFLRGRASGQLSPAFQERIMLAVTSVNRCRYCSFLHLRVAVRAGVSPEEARALLAGSVDDAPGDEAAALLYAQHWAETGGEPEPEATSHLIDTYGAERAEAIQAAIRMIMVGNYTGNTLDRALDWASAGTFGRRSHLGGAGTGEP